MPNVEARAKETVKSQLQVFKTRSLVGYFDYSYRYRRFVLLD
jgi:hypothetical protein